MPLVTRRGERGGRFRPLVIITRSRVNCRGCPDLNHQAPAYHHLRSHDEETSKYLTHAEHALTK